MENIMTSITSDIKRLLEADALSHSLSKEALQRMLNEIKDLTEERDTLQDNAESLRDSLKDAREKINDLRDKLTSANETVEEYKKRQSDLADREKCCLELEIRNEYEKQRGDENVGMLHLIFKNRQIRENITSNYPVENTYTQHPDSQGYGGYTNKTHENATKTTDTTTIEE